MMINASFIGQCSINCKQALFHHCLGGKSDGYDYNK